MDSGDVHDLDAAATLAAAEDTVATRRAAEVREMRLLLHWCDLHDHLDEASKRDRMPGGDQLLTIGGEGTPEVAELCFAEYAIARQTGMIATRNAAADYLDLLHRLPRLYGAVQALGVELWVARKIAALSRRLSKTACAIVDIAVSAAAHESPRRLLELAEAKIIEADPDAHRDRVDQDAQRTGVWLSRRRPGQTVDEIDGEPAVQRVAARLAPGDAIDLDHTVDQLARLLADQADPDDPRSHDQWRAEAIALLADPHAAAAFLDGPPEQEAAEPDDPGQAARDRRRPAEIVVHLHHDALRGLVPGVARVEEIGPMLLDQLATMLGLPRRNLSVQPVIDLNDTSRVSGYEHPTRVRTRTRLRTGGDVFPHSTRATSRLDDDHATPYDPHGPPGQTGDHNDAPLTRGHHRAKTHRDYQVDQIALGVYRWRTPHGLARIVTPTGTRKIDLITTDDGTVIGETYTPAFRIELDG